MAKQVNIANSSYLLPLQGENSSDKGSKRSWGENLSDIIDALITVVNTLQGPDDIPESSEPILNTAGVKDIVSFHFNSSSVKSFEASYNVSRLITKEIASYSGDGSLATVSLSYNHDLKNGDLVTITGTGDIDVTGLPITKVNATSFTVSSGFTGGPVLLTGQFQIELIESGIIMGNYSQNGWGLGQVVIDNARLIFDIDNNGTITYENEILDGVSPEGLIKFVAKSLISI